MLATDKATSSYRKQAPIFNFSAIINKEKGLNTLLASGDRGLVRWGIINMVYPWANHVPTMF